MKETNGARIVSLLRTFSAFNPCLRFLHIAKVSCLHALVSYT